MSHWDGTGLAIPPTGDAIPMHIFWGDRTTPWQKVEDVEVANSSKPYGEEGIRCYYHLWVNSLSFLDCMGTHTSIYLSIDRSIHPSIHPSIYIYICVCVSKDICDSLCMYIYIYTIVYNGHTRMTTYLHILKTYMSVIMWVV